MYNSAWINKISRQNIPGGNMLEFYSEVTDEVLNIRVRGRIDANTADGFRKSL